MERLKDRPMEALFYLNLATKKASESLGGSSFKFPALAYGEEIALGLRFSQKVGGETAEVSRVVRQLRASIGKIDARPETGKIQIKVGVEASVDGYNVTEDIAHNASAATVEAALNALDVVGTTYGAATVEAKAGSWLITFTDETAAVELSASRNSLFPLSFLKVRASEFDGAFVHELRLVQAPVASTAQSERVLPPPPSISTIENGGTEGSFEWSEVQKLFIPPTFRGVYRLRRGFKTTSNLSRDDGADDIARAMNESLLDETSEAFSVTLPDDDSLHISFDGDLKGINHDPLEVEVIDAPEGDLTFYLNLNAPELAALLRVSPKVTLPIEIDCDIEDVNDSEKVRSRKIFRDTITIERGLNFEELSTAASIDWLRPPLPKTYVPFSTGQVSNGQLHYATADFGDSVQKIFVFDHNLDSDRVSVVIHENASTGAPLTYGTPAQVAAGEADYTYTRASANSLEVTFFAAPANLGKLVTVLSLEQTSFFDLHGHLIAEITGLQAILDNLGQRISVLEARSGSGKLTSNEETGVQAAQWEIPPFFEVFPLKKPVAAPESRLFEIDAKALGRSKGLLPAVHSATVEVLPFPLPAASATYADRVFRNDTGGTVLLTGGAGIASERIDDGEFAACDGRLWYSVTRHGEHAAAVSFSTDFATDSTGIAATDNEFEDGAIVTVTSTGTAPAPLVAGNEYEAYNRDDDRLELVEIGSDEPIVFTDNGTGAHSLAKSAESTYYPTAFERELFRIHVNERQLRLKKRFELRFALEVALLNSDTAGLWSLVIEVGEKTEETTPARTGRNLAAIVWRGTPLFEQEIVLSPLSTVHRFGMKIDRELIADVDTITATSLVYGATEGAISPKTANFALRARLVRFDTEDRISDPTGFVAVRGFKIESNGGDNLPTEGSAFIN